MVAKAIGSKLAPFLDKIVPLLLEIMIKLDPNSSVDIDNELSEACLSTLQSIIRRCPREVTPYVPKTIEYSLDLLSYDPNYIYDENENEEMEEEVEDWGSDFDDEEQEKADDDDDTSWKVRRGAIHVIEAVVKTKPDFLKIIIESHSLVLVDRFKERVDDVKCNLL
jgi:cullin-associated NEDD8-dissociated protein 1